MDESSSDFRNTLVELIDESPRPSDHPSADRWIAYHRGALPPEEEALLQDHLARCRDCFDLAAGAAEFALPDEAPTASQELETAAVWRLVRPQPDPVPFPRRPPRRFRLPMTLAASFFIALIGLNVWQWRGREALQAPQANVATADLAFGERAAGPEWSFPAGGPRLLVIHPGDYDLPAYRLTIRDAATDRERSSHDLRPNQDLALLLYLPQGLPPGRYRLEIANGAGKVLETHGLRVTPGE